MVCSILVGPNTSVMTNWLWNLLNVGVALVGYHAAAFSIDWKWWGRKRMQVWNSNQSNVDMLLHADSLEAGMQSDQTALCLTSQLLQISTWYGSVQSNCQLSQLIAMQYVRLWE